MPGPGKPALFRDQPDRFPDAALSAGVLDPDDVLDRSQGSGFEKVLSAYRKQVNFTDDLKPVYSSSATWFKAVLPNLNYQLSAAVEKTVEKTVEKILSAIKQNPKVTQQQLADITGLSRRGVEWNLKKMQTLNIIRRKGGARGGHWILLKSNRSVSWGEQKKPKHQGCDGLPVWDLSSMIRDAAVCDFIFLCGNCRCRDS